MTQDELKLVLDALKWCHGGEPCGTAEAIAVVEKALAQPEQFCDANCVWTDHHPDCKLAQTQEPVAWMYQEYRDDDQFGWRDEILFTPPPNDPIYFRNITPVYTHPPQRTWVGLTRDEQSFVYSSLHDSTSRIDSFWVDFANAIEAKLREKNT